MGKPNQVKRLIRLDTPLGPDVLIPLNATGSEQMSELFTFHINAFSVDRHDIAPKELVGSPVTLELYKEDDTPRYFNGIVSELRHLGRSHIGERSQYSLTVVPALWLLGNTRDYRIYQEVDIKELIPKLLEPFADDIDFTIKFKNPHPKRRMVVQFNESYLNTLMRVLRMENIAFYFTHAKGKHTVHFIDDPMLLVAPPKDACLELRSDNHAKSHFSTWVNHRRFVPGGAEEVSYNYKTPEAPLKNKTTAPNKILEIPRASAAQLYRYTGYANTGDEIAADNANWLTRKLAGNCVVQGSGNYRDVEVGQVFRAVTVPDGAWPDKQVPYVFAQISWSASDIDGGGAFNMHFTAIPHGELVYPAKVERPLIPSLQTAVVVGPPGEEIFTDNLGRVRVRFHWDKYGSPDGKPENTACWLRVMQSFAGNGFGGHFTPRVGQEVVVAFEEGNPDRPFVLGALYHETHVPPYSGKPTQSGIRTRSTKQGGASNFNEIRFDDKKGSEQLFVQAEKDLDVHVKNNETRMIGKKLRIHAGEEIELLVGSSVIKITGNKIQISSGTVAVEGSSLVDIDGGSVQLN